MRGILSISALVAFMAIQTIAATSPGAKESRRHQDMAAVDQDVKNVAIASPTMRWEEKYIGLIEKTNLQLSAWYSPWNIISAAISTLSILFTVGAIVVTFLIFRQGRDFRETLEKDLEDKRKTLDQYLRENKGLIDSFIANSTKQIETLTKQLSSTSLNEEEKRKLQADLNRLALQREGLWGQMASMTTAGASFLVPQAPPPTPWYALSDLAKGKHVRTCPNCNSTFMASLTDPLSRPCPNCGK